MNLCLIYRITNKINGKVYIGQTWKTLRERFSHHCSKQSHCKYLYNAVQKHGKDNFSITYLTVCGTQETADVWEQYFIDLYNSRDRKLGYNIKSGGSHGKHSIQTKSTMNKDRIGVKRKPFSKEWKLKISMAKKGKPSWNKGLPRSKNHSINLSLALKGKKAHNKYSGELVTRMIDLFNSGLSTGEIGKQLSITRHTVRRHLNENGINIIGRKPRLSKEQKQKISQSMKGKSNTEGKKWKLIDGKRVYYNPNEEI